jgi:hypothetical protein
MMAELCGKMWMEDRSTHFLLKVVLDMLTFALCILLHLLYSKPTHALLLNTLSHPHFKTLKLLKNVL